MVKGRAYRRQQPQPVEAVVTNFIRQWRERPTEENPEGISQGKLAELSKLSDGSISNYETGKSDPSIGALQAISKALGVPRGMLLDVDPTKDPELWDSWLRATPGERQNLNKVAAGLVGPRRPAKRRA